MSVSDSRADDPRLAAAIREIEDLIRKRYPTASFSVSHGEDPEGTYLTAVVDVADADEVVDVFIERLLELQIEEELPLYVIPVETPERVARALEERRRAMAAGRFLPPRSI